MKTSDLFGGLGWVAFATFSFTVALSIISTDGLSPLAVIFSTLCFLSTLLSFARWLDGVASAIIDQARE